MPSSLQQLQVSNSRSEIQLEYADVVGDDYVFEILEPQGHISVEDQRERDREEWDRLQGVIARNVERIEAGSS